MANEFRGSCRTTGWMRLNDRCPLVRVKITSPRETGPSRAPFRFVFQPLGHQLPGSSAARTESGYSCRRLKTRPSNSSHAVSRGRHHARRWWRDFFRAPANPRRWLPSMTPATGSPTAACSMYERTRPPPRPASPTQDRAGKFIVVLDTALDGLGPAR